ncbi:MAG: aminoglycoside phosphotransferase family protein [Actinomycetota bacterium]|nr:aminoglycoside phosphotransferase family protein [Actinomycetota bacterium]
MTRNALLRRADWRFLVGMPEPQRAYCPVGGRLREAVLNVAARLLDEPAPGESDLAVLRNPGSRQLKRACAALAPGGALYVEWWHPVPGGGATLRRRLEAAELEQVACYWPWPAPRRRTPQVWLPIETREAVSWFLDTRPRPRRRLARVAAAAQRWLWRSLWRLGLLAPICVAARKPSSSAAAGDQTLPAERGAEGPGPSLPTILAAHHGAWGLDGTGDGAGCLLITAGRSPRNKLVALTFSAGRREPQIALKLPRVAEAEAGLEREASVLRAVHADGAREGIPRLVARATIAGRVALAESVVTGRPLLDVLLPETHRPLSLKVTDFLADLATASPRRSTAWREGVAEVALQALSPPEQQRARAILSRLGALPEVCEQRDCSPWNLLVQRDGAIAMLDWESAEQRGVPGLDLLYFLTYAGFFVDGTMHTGGELASYRRMLTPSSSTGRVYAESMAAYVERVGLDASMLEPLRLLCWLVHARAAQLRQEGETMGGREHGLLFLELARDELARQDRTGQGTQRS